MITTQHWHRRIWTGAALPVALVGLITAAAGSGGREALIFVAIVAISAAAVFAAFPETRAAKTRWWLWFVPACAVGLVAAFGVVAFAGSPALWLLALLVITSPVVVAWLRPRLSRWWGSPSGDVTAAVVPDHAPPSISPPPPPARSSEPAPPDWVHTVTTEELCLVWRRSYLVLARLQRDEIPAQVAIARLRQVCLDELERRNPVGFAHWLHQGARPASDPSRYVLGPSVAPPPVQVIP